MRADRGFSLIETMLAILILGTGLAGLTHGITAALRASKESERQTKAALFSAGQIEILRAERCLLEGETEGDCGSGLANYGWRQTVKPGSIDTRSGTSRMRMVRPTVRTAHCAMVNQLAFVGVSASRSSYGKSLASRRRELIE